jgi:alpha-beta hydrolase superfamily lysophospholipase
MVKESTVRHIIRYRALRNISCCLFAAWAITSSSADAVVVRDDDSELSKKTGVPLYVWQEENSKPLVIFIAIHGSAQDGAVMDRLASSLAKLGYLVIAPDIRGNGRWQLADGPKSSMYDDFVQSIADLERLLLRVNEAYPNCEIFCLGESIGAGIVLKAVAESPRQVKGIILCSAGFRPHLHNPLNMRSSFLMGMAKMVAPVDLSDYLTRYASDDARVAREMINDPLAKNRQSGLDLIGTFNFLNQELDFAANAPREISVLMIQGTEDQIVEPKSAERVFSVLKSKNKKFVLLPSCGHVLVGTSFIKPEVLNCIEGWLSIERNSVRAN